MRQDLYISIMPKLPGSVKEWWQLYTLCFCLSSHYRNFEYENSQNLSIMTCSGIFSISFYESCLLITFRITYLISYLIVRITWNYGGEEVYIIGSFTSWEYIIKMHKNVLGITPVFEISMVTYSHILLMLTYLVCKRRAILLLLHRGRKSKIRPWLAFHYWQKPKNR